MAERESVHSELQSPAEFLENRDEACNGFNAKQRGYFESS